MNHMNSSLRNCVMSQVGLNTAHDRVIAGTAAWDKFDYISDNPVGNQVAQLLYSHPGELASFIMTLRNPWDWHRSRTKAHLMACWNDWRPTNGGCGTNFTTVWYSVHVCAFVRACILIRTYMQ